MVTRSVTQIRGNAFCETTRDTKRPNWRLWMNLSPHSYILNVSNIQIRTIHIQNNSDYVEHFDFDRRSG